MYKLSCRGHILELDYNSWVHSILQLDADYQTQILIQKLV